MYGIDIYLQYIGIGEWRENPALIPERVISTKEGGQGFKELEGYSKRSEKKRQKDNGVEVLNIGARYNTWYELETVFLYGITVRCSLLGYIAGLLLSPLLLILPPLSDVGVSMQGPLPPSPPRYTHL